MRVISLLAAAALLAGCVAEDTGGPNLPGGNETLNPTPGDPGALPNLTQPIGERHSSTERFVLLANHTLGVLGPQDPAIAEATVPEDNEGLAFYASMAEEPNLVPWSSFPFRVPFEITDPFEVRISFTSATPAASPHPTPLEIPPVVGWFGTPDRMAYFAFAQGAPQTIEANKVYTATFTVTPEAGGFFVRAGEQIALYLFLGYQAVDNSRVSYVVGGAEPAGFELPHEHFNVTASRATVILDASAEIEGHAGVSTADHPKPALFPFTVPADAVYIVAEVTGTSSQPGRLDADLSVQTSSGETLGSGSGPTATETVVLGPSALEAARELVAKVGTAGPPGSVRVKVTAYSP